MCDTIDHVLWSFDEEHQVGEMRTLIPKDIHIMALTETAKRSLTRAVCKTLGMDNPVVVAVSPDKMFSMAHFESQETTYQPTMEKLKCERASQYAMNLNFLYFL